MRKIAQSSSIKPPRLRRLYRQGLNKISRLTREMANLYDRVLAAQLGIKERNHKLEVARSRATDLERKLANNKQQVRDLKTLVSQTNKQNEAFSAKAKNTQKALLQFKTTLTEIIRDEYADIERSLKQRSGETGAVRTRWSVTLGSSPLPGCGSAPLLSIALV